MTRRLFALTACLIFSVEVNSTADNEGCAGECAATAVPESMAATEVEYEEQERGELMRMELLQGGIRGRKTAIGEGTASRAPVSKTTPTAGSKAAAAMKCTPSPQEFSFSEDRLTNNNLGGAGPGTGAKDITYARAGRTQGHGDDFDIKVTTASPYHPDFLDRQGVAGKIYGCVRVAAKEEVALTYSFVNSATGENVTVSDFYFTFFDIDQTKKGNVKEVLKVRDVDGYHLEEGSEVQVNTADGLTTFTSSKPGWKCDNPKTTLELGQVKCRGKMADQKKRFVTLFFKGPRSSFDVTLAAPCTKKCKRSGGRNFLFSTKPKHVCIPSPPPVPIDACKLFKKFGQGNLLHNNLGGQGPIKTDPQEMRFTDVLKDMPSPVDMVITSDANYDAIAPKKNGASGWSGLLRINIRCGTKTTLHFKFVSGGTDNIFNAEKFYFTVFDIDAEKGLDKSLDTQGVESITSRTHSSWHLGSPTELVPQELSDGHGATFTATVSGVETDNPTNPFKLTPLASGRTISFEYHNTGEFDLDISVSPGSLGRNYLFFLGSALVCLDGRRPSL